MAVELDGVLAPYGGSTPAGHTVHETESAAWRAEAVIPPPRARGPRLALNPAPGRALAGLPADLVLVTSYTRAELEPLLPALGWDTVPPLVPLRVSGAAHYVRPDDRVLSPSRTTTCAGEPRRSRSGLAPTTGRWRGCEPETTTHGRSPVSPSRSTAR